MGCDSLLIIEKGEFMKKTLIILFSLILLAMLAVTSWASTYENVFAAGRLLKEPWMVATLFDAYFGFITFFVWVCVKESSVIKKLVWFVLIMALGNIAMSVYVLLEVRRLKDHFTVQRFLTEVKPA